MTFTPTAFGPWTGTVFIKAGRAGDHNIRLVGAAYNSNENEDDLSGIPIFLTREDLEDDANLVYPNGTYALVISDDVLANNDFYRKTGDSGEGDWGEPLGKLSTVILNGQIDLENLDAAVNGAADRPNPGHPAGTVTLRNGETHKTLANILGLQTTQEQIATAQALLARAYANADTNEDIEGAEPGERGAKYWTDRAETARAGAEVAASTAESAAGPTYPDTATGLAATTDGQSFAVDNGDGTVTVYLNNSGVAVEQRTLATTAALASTDAGKGAALVGYKQPDAGAQALSVTDALLAGVHTYNVWFYMTPAMRADALAGTKLLDHSPAFQACIDAAVAAKVRQIFIPFSRGQIYYLGSEVNIPRTSAAESSWAIYGDATPRYDPEYGGHITGDPLLPTLFSFDNYSTASGSNNFTIKGVNAYSSSARTQAFIHFTTNNNGPNRGFQFLENSAKGFKAVYLFDANVPADRIRLAAASVNVWAGCYRENTDVVKANTRIFGLSVGGGIQSEQGARYSGNLDGPITFRDAMLEGQTNVINIDSFSPQLDVSNNYIEHVYGDYFARIKGTNDKASLLVTRNYVSNHQATDFYRVEGVARVIDDGTLKISSTVAAGRGILEAPVTFLNGLAHYGSQMSGKFYVGTGTGEGMLGYLVPKLYQKGGAASKQALGNETFHTPLGVTHTGYKSTGYASVYHNLAKTYAAGDMLIVTALVRSDGGAPRMAVFNDAYSEMAALSQTTVLEEYKGEWTMLTLVRKATTAGTVGRVRLGPEGSVTSSSYTMDVAAIGFDVLPASKFETRNGDGRALIRLHCPFNPTPYLRGSSAYAGATFAIDEVKTITASLPEAMLGDFVTGISYDQNLLGLSVSAYVGAANSINISVHNGTGAAVTLPSGNFYYEGRKR